MLEEKIAKLADEMCAKLKAGERPNGDKFVKLEDDRPEWMQDCARAAHEGGNILPDDWRYKFIDEAVMAISDNEGKEDEARGSIDADIYTASLLAWVSSTLSRTGYADEMLSEHGSNISSFGDLLMLAQHAEKMEVFDAVYNFLRDKAEEEEE